MSRSYRKPYITDQQSFTHAKWYKRKAARVVRKTEDVSDGKQYRKHYNPWNIRDWSFHDPDNKKARRK